MGTGTNAFHQYDTVIFNKPAVNDELVTSIDGSRSTGSLNNLTNNLTDSSKRDELINTFNGLIKNILFNTTYLTNTEILTKLNIDKPESNLETFFNKRIVDVYSTYRLGGTGTDANSPKRMDINVIFKDKDNKFRKLLIETGIFKNTSANSVEKVVFQLFDVYIFTNGGNVKVYNDFDSAKADVNSSSNITKLAGNSQAELKKEPAATENKTLFIKNIFFNKDSLNKLYELFQ